MMIKVEDMVLNDFDETPQQFINEHNPREKLLQIGNFDEVKSLNEFNQHLTNTIVVETDHTKAVRLHRSRSRELPTVRPLKDQTTQQKQSIQNPKASGKHHASKGNGCFSKLQNINNKVTKQQNVL